MKTKLTLLLIIFTIMFFVALTSQSKLNVQAQDQNPPTLIPGEVLTPAPTPSDPRELAILTLSITSSPDGKVEKISLEKGKIIKSYAPNIIDRISEWTVKVQGEKEFQFGISDPRRINIYPQPKEQGQTPHQTELLTQITVDLVVPLYVFEQDIAATTIQIYNQDGALVFSTPVDREKWR